MMPMTTTAAMTVVMAVVVVVVVVATAVVMAVVISAHQFLYLFISFLFFYISEFKKQRFHFYLIATHFIPVLVVNCVVVCMSERRKCHLPPVCVKVFTSSFIYR